MGVLKPFVFNLDDLNFILQQINFRPLFDADGNAIINWDGTGAIYDPYGNPIWDGLGMSAADALAMYGTSYSSVTVSWGLRQVTGLNNNLSWVHSTWGAVDQPFLRTVPADFTHYLAAVDGGSYESSHGGFASSLSTPSGTYEITFAPNGDPVMASVVDYTPRMISRTITTGDVTFAMNGMHIAYDADGRATVVDYGLLDTLGQTDHQNAANTEHFIGAQNPGVAPANGWFALFGQFFDHGLDFIGKASQQKIVIALATDDPLYGVIGPDGQPTTSITITRATVAGQDANGDPTYINHTSPYIDQSQTYGQSDQVTQLLREWVSTDGATYHAGREMLDGMTLATAWQKPDGTWTNNTLPTLNELRAHLVATDRDDLTWEDISNLRNRDASGHVIAGSSDQPLLLDMNPHFDGVVAGTGHISDTAIATFNAQFGTTYTAATFNLSALMPYLNMADFSIHANLSQAQHDAVSEILLESIGDHYIAGDGRANENFGLTTIHHVFHEEHNYQVGNIINAIYTQDAASGDPTHSVLHKWQIDTGNDPDANGNFLNADGSIAWNDDLLFNAAKLTVEMEYQHTAVDQYARSVTPDIPEFVGYSTSQNGTVSLEYAQAAFRFGHSTLRETIDTMDPTGGLTGEITSYALRLAFLNPQGFADIGPAAIALGMTHQQMNEVDEFITPALNQGLLGQPLDLAAINIARGRDIGLPTLNDFREALGFARYESWADFGAKMIHPESLVNFIAAYSFDGDVARAQAIIGLESGTIAEVDPEAMGYTVEDAINFLNGGDLGFNKIDTWIGGLAEAHVLGGLLGETFNAVFTDQIIRLMDGDRFYYLYRLVNQQFGDEIQNEQFKDIVERNTGLTHLNGNIFGYADQYYDLSADATSNAGAEHKYGLVIDSHPSLGIWTAGGAGTATNGSVITFNGKQYIRDIRAATPGAEDNLDGTASTGADSNEVLVATNNDDYVHMGAGDDTVYGDDGNDILYGDAGVDRMYGGDGNDLMYGGDGPDVMDGGDGDDILYGESSGTAMAGVDQLIGGAGNDIIYGGIGIDKLFGGSGDDVIYGDSDTDPFTHGGDGNDYIDGGTDGDNLYGDNGDDVIVGGSDQDILAGGDGDDILRPGNPSQAMGGGPDEVLGGDGFTDTGFDLIDFSDYVPGPNGVNADMATQANPLVAIDGTTPFPAWTQIEGIVGSQNNDTEIGDTNGNWLIGGSGNDTMTGGAGNDVVVGGSVRLDALIGSYSCTYTAYDALVGASHRTTGTLGAGLLDNAALGTTEFAKHFTEMLKTERFKDTVLGDNGADGTTDTAVFSGNYADYSVAVVTFGAITAYKITDNRPGSPDGIDLVVGVERFQFADGLRTTAQLINHAPTGSVMLSNTTPTRSLAVTANTSTIADQDGLGSYSYQWQRSADGIAWTTIAGAIAATFTPGASEVGQYLRAVVNYTDGLGNHESVASATTEVVGDIIFGNGAANALNGTAGADIISGLGGNDVLNGNAGNDSLDGGSGNDTLDGGLGADTMTGGSGNDTFVVDNAGDMVIETSGTDTVQTTLTSYALPANVENLTFTGTGDFIGTGNNLRNVITGGAGNDQLFGLGGNDTLVGNGGNDLLDGGTGNDSMSGGQGNDIYVVDSTGDTVTEGNNAGTDTVQSSVNFTLGSNVENLTLTGTANRSGTGNSLANTIIGNDGNNSLSGGGGADILDGGAGNDTLYGGSANDTLTGGLGADSFVFNTALNQTGVDTITDFNVPGDTIRIDNAVFGGIGNNGVLSAAFFSNDGGAHDSNDRIIYNPTNGWLSYDSNGNATGGTVVHFATLGTNLALTNADILVI